MQSEKDKNPSATLKKIAVNMQNNRKNFEAHSSNIVNSIDSHKQTFNDIEPLVRSQAATIDSMKQFSRDSLTDTSKNLQSKRIFMTISEQFRQQIKNYTQIIQQAFLPSYKSSMLANVNTNMMSGSKNQSAFSEESAAEQSWNKIWKDMDKNLSSLEEESIQSVEKMFGGVKKMNEIKQNLLSQIIKLMIYQKNVLWRDLNAPYDDYIHGDVKSIINQIKANEEKLGYIPSKLKFDPIKFQGTSKGEADYLQLLSIHLEDFAEITEGLRNYSKLSGQQMVIQDISKNEHIVKGLRERVERLTINYDNLLERYRSLQISKVPTNKMTSSQNASQEKSLGDRLDEMEGYLVKKQQEILEYRQSSLKADSTIQSLKDKNKELEDELSKFQKYQQPKIKELEANQKNILEEFTKVKRDLDTYTNIVSIQREEKLKLVEDLKEERKRVSELAFILGRERRRIKDLKVELNGKERIIMELVDELPEQVTKPITTSS